MTEPWEPEKTWDPLPVDGDPGDLIDRALDRIAEDPEYDAEDLFAALW